MRTRTPPRRPPGVQETYPGSEYSDEEREFLTALDRYKRRTGRPWPTWLEVLNVLRRLGWRKVAPENADGHA
jgi:predicted nucleic acid-binding protein